MEKYITMRDGVRLFTSIYYPKDNTENHPILITRTPYSCSPYGEDKMNNAWNSYLIDYMREGYILVTQDVRGRWMSEGQFVNVRPFNPAKKGKDIDEASDTWDTIDWLIKNVAHNNGKVGVFGISYPGFFSTMAAASNHPALVAVSPQAPVTNRFMAKSSGGVIVTPMKFLRHLHPVKLKKFPFQLPMWPIVLRKGTGLWFRCKAAGFRLSTGIR
jgi:putative CocE/NonD family hydrolase